jgi:hypothetical protein
MFFFPSVLLEFSGIMHGLDDIFARWKGGSLICLIPLIRSLDILWCCAKSVDTKDLMGYVICLH